MNTANLNMLIQRYEDNFEWINNEENDEIFKWRAVRCFQDVWFSEAAEGICPFPRSSRQPQKSALYCSIMGRYPPQTES